MTISEDPLPIRRCVCAGVTFESLRSAGVRTLEEAEAHGCGIKCRLCRPYLARMLATGETAFAVDQALG